ncbi:MAG: hypothetical protein CL854_07290 [Cryomorphaceae bacterium]|nr:hypothetical protein [Cryomorphaceae bacterium]
MPRTKKKTWRKKKRKTKTKSMSNNVERNSERNSERDSERDLERHESLDGSGSERLTAPTALTVTQDIFTTCPHCGGMVHIPATQINCNVFRHAFFKSTGLQIDPHTPKIECDRLLHEDLIWGCGKPFRLELEQEQNQTQDQLGNTYHAIRCEYI